MRPYATRFLRQLSAEVFGQTVIAAFDTATLVDAIGREEHVIHEVGQQARLTVGQTEGAVRELEAAGYIETVGMLVRLTPSGARWYAMHAARKSGR